MALFPDTIAASLAGHKVEAAWLIRFDFASSTMRLWTGTGTLYTVDGEAWLGAGELVSVSGIEQAVNGQAPQATFTMSAIDSEMMRLARDEYEAEVKGRTATVLVQFFGTDLVDDPDNQRVLDAPYPVWSGRMLAPNFNFDQEGKRSVSVEAESLFSLRSRPQYSMYTDADQQHRYPGDKGFEFVGSLVDKTVTWPDY